jgi:predicted house-cleaning NTP pyrophosphatase (Maf/HAM1 superfamily)
MEQKTLAESSSSVATAADVITDAAAKTIKLTLDQHERELSDMREILNSRFCVTMEFEIYPKSKMISQTITMLPKLNGRTLPMPPAHERKRASM